MTLRYLSVTFRDGKPLAAYLHLPRADGAKVVRTTDAGRGILVDHDEHGRAIGVEITAPLAITVDDVNAVLESVGHAKLAPGEWTLGRAA
jgi:uncharacterized protein YuzE